MSLEQAKSQMKKGLLEFCVLSVLSKKESYPPDIIDTLKNAKLIVVEGTLYPILTRLKNEGLLSYRWEESPSGPPRKYYQLTSEGKANLEELTKAWKEIEISVNQISKN
jgi:PadR family transcriptional regulator, regulatory protein PadR